MVAALAGCRKALVGTLPFYELHFWDAVHMAAALAGCRKALVSILSFYELHFWGAVLMALPWLAVEKPWSGDKA